MNRTNVRIGEAILFILLLTALTPLSAARSVESNRADNRDQPIIERAQDILKAAGVEGGLVVHIGCGDGRLTAALRAGGSFVIHGLDSDPKNVEAARAHVRSLGLYGRVSIEHWEQPWLPYTDNLVNLLVISGSWSIEPEELLRVLAPNGVAWFVDARPEARKLVKPRPEQLDEWTHFLHGPDNNAVAHDLVSGSPHHLQWLAEPSGARHHDVLATISAMVVSGGRIFVIEDEGPTASILLPARWTLVARDAFNGLLLWKQPIGKWESQYRKFRSGPTHLPRRLVAEGPRVYVTLGYDAPVTAHDAATGQMVRTYAGTERADEIVLGDGVLYVARHDGDRPALWAIEAGSGRAIWRKQESDIADIATQTLAVGQQLYAQIGNEIVSWDRATGKQVWRVGRGKGGKGGKDAVIGDSSRTSTLVAWHDTILSADGDTLVALDAGDGRKLWTVPTDYGFQSPIDVFVADGLVWTGTGARIVEKVAGRDPRSGAVQKEFDTGNIYRNAGAVHHRCYRNKATERFLVLGRAGGELIDLENGDTEQNNWVRGVCQYGVIPCNGMIYVPPHACGCYLQAKLNGFYGLAPKRAVENPAAGRASAPESRLARGPAYPLSPRPQGHAPSSSDWPTYRHDAVRSGWTTAKVSTKIQPAWQTALGGKPSAPVMAEGKILVTVPDAHLVCALLPADGELAWQFTTGGRVDSPPTARCPARIRYAVDHRAGSGAARPATAAARGWPGFQCSLSTSNGRDSTSTT
jgi:outer membrane protein assembly factor BamB